MWLEWAGTCGMSCDIPSDIITQKVINIDDKIPKFGEVFSLSFST
jgi:hypothetical protein